MCVTVACVDAVFPRLSQLLPLMSDLEYLQDQHLLLSVKSCDGFESYGQSDQLRLHEQNLIMIYCYYQIIEVATFRE